MECYDTVRTDEQHWRAIIMLYQTMQVGEERRKDMLVEAEKQRMLAEIRQHEDGPVRRALTMTGRTLIAIGEALTPPASQPKAEPCISTES
jgi:hypothetical protein